jgi:hypothetical protein
MMFTGIASRLARLDLGTFECVMCNYAEEVVVPASMTGWINSSGLQPPN